VNIDGTFNPSQIWWSSGTGCSGTGYLNDGGEGAGGLPTYYKTLAWSGATNSWYVVTGTVTKGSIESIPGAGTISFHSSYYNDTGYITPNFSTENSGNTNGSYACSINQAYEENLAQNGVVDINSAAVAIANDSNGAGFSGWQLTSFDPQITLGWPAFTTCTVNYGPGYNNAAQAYTASGTTSNSCLAGPLQLP
jgi:hypothetical protein